MLNFIFLLILSLFRHIYTNCILSLVTRNYFTSEMVSFVNFEKYVQLIEAELTNFNLWIMRSISDGNSLIIKLTKRRLNNEQHWKNYYPWHWLSYLKHPCNAWPKIIALGDFMDAIFTANLENNWSRNFAKFPGKQS